MKVINNENEISISSTCESSNVVTILETIESCGAVKESVAFPFFRQGL